MKLDKWQEELITWKGNTCTCAGRQSGKSTAISIKAGESAMDSKKTIMIISAVERQAHLLFEKVLAHIHSKNKNIIKTGKDRPTKTKLQLRNGSIIYCLPTGDSGYGIRGFTINELYADEAHFINEDVWAAVTPMLATTGGTIHLLSTPFGTEGYFYRCFYDENFKSFHVKTEEVAQGREDPQKTSMLEFLKDEKLRMTKLQYQQEYMGLFVGGVQRFIPDELINQCCIIIPMSPKGVFQHKDKFQGIDIARMGGDETVMISVKRLKRKRIEMIDLEIPEGQSLTNTARLIIYKDKQINHKSIYMDDGGLGVGVYDMLFEDNQTKNKVVGLNNAKREIDQEEKNNWKDSPRKKPLLGIEMAINLKVLMEQNLVKLFDDPRIRHSLRSMQYEISEGKLKIYGNYDHIFEALKRAAWCMKCKRLNIMAFCK